MTNGDVLALEELVTRYAALIRSAISRVAGSRAADISDDVSQRVTVAIWKRLEGEQPIEHPASYLYRCAIRETLRELGRLDDEKLTPLDDELVDVGLDPEVQLRGRQLGDVVERCLGDLQPERAQAVRAHLAGFEVAEIMELHEWPYNKARNLISRGLADLRGLLVERGHRDA